MNIHASDSTCICLVVDASLFTCCPSRCLWLDEANLTLAGILHLNACPIGLFDTLGCAHNPHRLRYRVVLEQRLSAIAAEK